MGHLTFDHIKCVCFWVLCPCVVKIFFWSQKILENCEKHILNVCVFCVVSSKSFFGARKFWKIVKNKNRKKLLTCQDLLLQPSQLQRKATAE